MIELTMKELYSPRVAKINVYSRMASMSKNTALYPDHFHSSKWHFLTELEPENRKGTQHFTVISRGWVKYLGIHIMEYHGMGTACTINDISVFGLSPVNNLESLLEEAVQDEMDSGELGSVTADVTHEQESVRVATNDKIQGTHLENGESKNDISAEHPLPLDPISELEERTETPKTDSEEKRIEQEEESTRKAVKSTEAIPSVSTFRKMHQDVQTLKGSTTVLSQYVDELHGGLMQTIDELWKAQKTTKTDTDSLNQQLTVMHMSLRRMENSLEMVQLEQRASIRKSQITMGIMGFCVSFIGLIGLKYSTFSNRSQIFIFTVYLLCCLNFIVSFLNIAAVLSPTVLIKISQLRTKIRPHWRSVFTG